MGKIAYRRNRRRPRRNPTLLTLVNPSKSKPKAKAKPKASATAKKQVAAAKKQASVAKKAAKKATRTAKEIEKASAAIKRQLASAKKSLIEVSGRQPKKTRKSLTGKKTKAGEILKWDMPKRGFHRVSSRGRGSRSAEGYWRFQPNAGGAMKGRRRRVVRRKARKPSWMSNPYFGKKRARKNAPKRKPLRKRSRKAAPKKALKRKSVRKSTRKAAPRKARKSTRKGAKRNPMRRRSLRRKGRKNASRRKYRRNPISTPMKALSQAAAGFAGLMLGRLVNNIMARHVVPMLPTSIAPMAPLLGTGAGVVLAYYLPKKVKKLGPINLETYKTALLVGASVAFLDVILSTVATKLPESVVNYLAPPMPMIFPGQGGFGAVWPQSFSHEAVGYASNPMLPGRNYGVQPMGEYVRSPMGEYITGVGEYVSDNLDAGVISDGLYGDPGDDDLDIEVLD